MISPELRQEIAKLLNKYSETAIVGIEYAVNEDEDGFTIEATDFIVSEGNGETDSMSASEHNEDLACDLNEVLFDYIDQFNGEDQPAYGQIEL